VGCNGGFGRSIAEDVTEHRLISYLLRLKDEENPFNDYIVNDYSDWLRRTNRSTRNRERQRANAENVPGDESTTDEDAENAEPPLPPPVLTNNNTNSTIELEEEIMEIVSPTFQLGDDLEEVEEDDDFGNGVSFSTHFASTNNNNNNNNNCNTGPRVSFQFEANDSPVFRAIDSPIVEKSTAVMPSSPATSSHASPTSVFASHFTQYQSRVVTPPVAPFQSPLFNSSSQHNIEKANPAHVHNLPTNPYAFSNPLTQSLPSYGYAMYVHNIFHIFSHSVAYCLGINNNLHSISTGLHNVQCMYSNRSPF
jgi:hypothetical protein